MRLAWLRIRFTVRKALGIRDIRQGTLRQRINELESQRGMSREPLRAAQLLGRCLFVAALAVVVWVAINR